ncbi:PPE family protein [Mycobacterium sp.]|uniref:PPE family protein n=1 Tax=Mycobacterium sp. TaxID=1785 RepID=UPI0031E3887B
MLDYGMLPPEVNSARMYSGAGAGPIMAAASAWNGLATELSSVASDYESVIGRLSSEEWTGPASAAMVAAIHRFITWMSTAAAQAQLTARQAQAAAAAYETAFAMTVPPQAVAANRTQLATLVATNVLGQNTPEIMATEAHYGEMWAQDAAVMYGYAANSASASQLTPFSSPTQVTNQAGVAGQAAAVTQAAGTAAGNSAQVAQLMSSVPSALQSLAAPLQSATSTSGLSGVATAASAAASSVDYPSVILNGVSSGAATATMYIPSTLIPNLIGYFAGAGGNAANGIAGPFGGLGALLAPGGPLSSLGALGGGTAASTSAALSGTTSAVSAELGHAGTVGAMSVPASWSAATPAGTGSATLAGTGWAAAPESHTLAAMPGGMPTGGIGNRGGFGFGAPRYGFKPTVIARPVMAG